MIGDGNDKKKKKEKNCPLFFKSPNLYPVPICFCISRVSYQNGISPLYIIVEIYHSGWKPSIYFQQEMVAAC